MAKQTYENALKRLNEIVKTLEGGGLSLDESVKLFEEGAKLSAFLNKELKKAEQKIISLEDINGENDE